MNPSALPIAMPVDLQDVGLDSADLERRFGGLRRLYGAAGYRAVRDARVAVVGLGGVGSWAAEALARSGVARLVLIDLDHVAESNINRQVQALGSTLGMAKAEALRQRIADIHPGCEVIAIEEFAGPDNWPGLLSAPRPSMAGRPPWGSSEAAKPQVPECVEVDVLIDACDQSAAKLALAAWALQTGTPLVCVGAAGGKQQAQRVEVADLAEVTHDPLLASLRQRLRKQGAPRQGRIGVTCVFSRENVAAPADADADACTTDGTLNCAGYGSTVIVTATFGLVAAGEALQRCIAARAGRST